MFPNRSPYRIGLFDDIHTYLPELLYNRGRFRNVQDILDYVHDVASHQLNPWPAAVADYTARVTADINPMFAATTTPIYRRASGPNRRYPGAGELVQVLITDTMHELVRPFRSSISLRRTFTHAYIAPYLYTKMQTI